MIKVIITRTIIMAGIIVSAILITSCSNKKENNTGEDHHVGSDTIAHDDKLGMDSTSMAYACPMHPDVSGKAGDTCSKCGMKLETVIADSTKAHVEHEH